MTQPAATRPPRAIPRAEDQPVLTPREYAEIVGLNLGTVYDGIRRGDLPTVKISPRRIGIPTAHVRRMFGLDQ